MSRMSGISIAAALSLPLAGAASAADLTGPWLLHAEWGGSFKYDMICGLTQKGQAVSGPCMAIGVRPESAAGHMDANKLEIEYQTVFQGYDVAVQYTGEVDGLGVVRGPVNSGQISGQFVGQRIGDIGPMTSWKLHVGVGNFDFQMLCAFKTNGRSIRGPCGAGDGNVVNAVGTSDDKGVSFAYDVAIAGKPMHVTYTGAVQPDGSIKGTATDGTNTGVFTAKKK
jgi:hypothetical protein